MELRNGPSAASCVKRSSRFLAVTEARMGEDVRFLALQKKGSGQKMVDADAAQAGSLAAFYTNHYTSLSESNAHWKAAQVLIKLIKRLPIGLRSLFGQKGCEQNGLHGCVVRR
jgi:hypothetical protein